MTIPSGTHFGPYEIEVPIGAGGMGEVYRAIDRRLGRNIAIKVLPEHLADDAESLARFENEAKAVAALSPPQYPRDTRRRSRTRRLVRRLGTT